MSVNLLHPLRYVKQSFKALLEPQELEEMGFCPQEWRGLGACSHIPEGAIFFAPAAFAAPRRNNTQIFPHPNPA